MIRLILSLILIFPLLFAKDDIDAKIGKTSSKLSSFSKNHNSLNKKMAYNAKAILRQREEVNKQSKYLKKLKRILKTKEKTYKSNNKKLLLLNSSQEKLQNKQKKVEENLVFYIAQTITLSLIVQEEHSVDIDSLIEFEVLKKVLKNSRKEVKELNDIFYANSKDIDSLNKDRDKLKKSIKTIDIKRKDVLAVQKANKKALQKLNNDKFNYKMELKKLLSKQDTLKKTLAGLNIIKIDRVKKAKEERARKKAFESRKKFLNTDLPKVKQHASSYKSVKTKKYSGSKTIAPLKSYTITKKYGTYTDPIYGIKIFNESISLKPKTRDAKVRTVFNGKVIYADKTAVLNNIVIVEHKNGLHTIYANLSRIQKNIKKGVKIKKGYAIGRVSDELIFEVTQKSFHINPIRLFK